MAAADLTGERAETRVTIGIPTFNRVGLLREAVDSVLAQTIDDWELFVFDDGSTDGTPELMASYTDERIHYVRNPRNLGHPANITQVLRAGSAPYVGVLFDDDVMFPEHLQRMCALLEAYPRAAVAHSAYELWTAHGERKAIVADGRTRPFEQSGTSFIRKAVANPPGIWVATALMRREAVRRLQFRVQDEPATDVMFWLRVARNGTVVYDPVPTACYRVTEGYSSENNFLAISDGGYQPTFGTVEAYQRVFDGFHAEQTLSRVEDARLRLIEQRTIHGLLQAVIRRRWHEEPSTLARLRLLRRAFALDPSAAADPLVWTKVTLGALRPRRDGGGPTMVEEPEIDLTQLDRDEATRAAEAAENAAIAAAGRALHSQNV